MTGEIDVNELRFDGRVALITGSGRGLGREYALALAARGASVVVNDPGVGLLGEGGDMGPAQDVVEEITAAGGKATATFDAVGTVAAADAMVAAAIDAFGRLDIVINNGGNFLPRHGFEETTPESFESLWRVHVLGATQVIRAAWPHMKRQGHGRIVNTASHSGYLGAVGSIEYAAAKAGDPRPHARLVAGIRRTRDRCQRNRAGRDDPSGTADQEHSRQLQDWRVRPGVGRAHSRVALP